MLRSITRENHSNQAQARDFGEQQESDASKACISLVGSTQREEQGWQSLPQGGKNGKTQGNKWA